MKKNLGVVQAVYPMPVLMVAAYDETGKVNVMNAAWGMICAMDKIALFIDEEHKTTQNLLKTKAFTVALADRAHMDVADFFGIASGNKMEDKFERTGYHAVKSEHVNAPIVEEFPVVMECELAEIITGKSLKEPKLTRQMGKAPQQTLDFDELFARNPIDSSSDIDDEDDMYGDGIDDEEIGLEGLEISDGNPYD